MESKDLYRYLRLEHFTDEEVHAVFDRVLCVDSSQEDEQQQQREEERISHQHLQNFLLDRIQELESENGLKPLSTKDVGTIQEERQAFAEMEASRILAALGVQHNTGTVVHATQAHDTDQTQQQQDKLNNNAMSLSRTDFHDRILARASSAEYNRTLPIAVSMLLVGSSVGIITPVMPFVVENLGLSPSQYGLVVSAFALSKMTANIPSAILVERHGRKPYLVYSLLLLSAGVGGVSFATSYEQLVVCRLLTGVGVAALSTAATMAISDIANPKNRAQTMAPMMSAFSAGTALGPAIGGLLADKFGINRTIEIVGFFYIGLTAINSIMLLETQPKPMVFPWQDPKKKTREATNEEKEQTQTIREATRDALRQWAGLMANPRVRNVVIMNGFYWVSLAGSQITLLPLVLTASDGLNMTATGVGQVYMGMSLVQVLGNPIFAPAVDRIGKAPAILAGCTLLSTSMASLPMASEVHHLIPILALWATGSSILSTAPIAYISDATDEKERAQAIALLRTSGDVGFLIGGTAAGAMADWTGNLEAAVECSAAALLTATVWFGFRKYLSNQVTMMDMKEEDEKEDNNNNDDEQRNKKNV